MPGVFGRWGCIFGVWRMRYRKVCYNEDVTDGGRWYFEILVSFGAFG